MPGNSTRLLQLKSFNFVRISEIMLCEGNSIRSVERMTGIHRDTVMRLGVRMGQGCKRIMDEKMRNLPSRLIQVDEIWGFIGMKNKTALRNRARRRAGDIWTWVALDSETKLVPTFAGRRPISIHGKHLH
jgi:hypothetical protein